ncbi:TetR/AcrR family transcriptional regulator [Streptomyces sp. DSM 40750]|uniref:TetR/AcrR family transcriptional regulator n=1 Tax=Streptomyces sp. DSM 40750 TaxID=2801030 RepID=UPI00214B073A|nr:TetR/AcrR family transcriptional regulator [Streptomyces sp. DSM 40750]UUU19053.1 TetR/AcrR family transcriptional regulator [Streptomyces sp. DSM 40750]UUU27603.1 TetR/AcrR family transcriptional regulator [Streptomyces sp. DSM 40750]
MGGTSGEAYERTSTPSGCGAEPNPHTGGRPRSRCRVQRRPLNGIAKRAGVGEGTLYRHFPNREALLAEAYRRDIEELVVAASALLAENEPVEAFRRWLDRVIDYADIKRGVLAALEAAAWQGLAAHSHNPIEGALGHLLDAGKAAGSIRADVDAHGVLLLIAYLGRLDRNEWESRARPLMNVILDGLSRQDADR